jgi:hypothetical protein
MSNTAVVFAKVDPDLKAKVESRLLELKHRGRKTTMQDLVADLLQKWVTEYDSNKEESQP